MRLLPFSVFHHVNSPLRDFLVSWIYSNASLSLLLHSHPNLVSLPEYIHLYQICKYKTCSFIIFQNCDCEFAHVYL